MMHRIFCILAAAAALTWAQDKASEPVNVELTVYLISGLAAGATTDDVPQDLASTVKQLHGLFNYKSYKLTESFVLRGRNSGPREMRPAGADGILPSSPNSPSMRYHFGYNAVRVSADRAVHIDGLRLEIRTPPRTSPDLKQTRSDTLANITTDLDIRENQKTVVGKSSVNSNGDALILVLVPKLVE